MFLVDAAILSNSASAGMSHGLFILSYFSAVIAAVGYTCLVLGSWTRSDDNGVAAWAVSISVFAAAQIIAVTQTLGYAGILSPGSILGAHLLLAALSAVWANYRHLLPIRDFSFVLVRISSVWKNLPRAWSALLAAMALWLVIAMITGALATPYDFDSHGYRLSRIGLWLQEGGIHHSETTDVRMNYSAIHGDLLMLWITAPFLAGYPLVCAVQPLGGILVVFSTMGLARLLGYERNCAILAGVLPLSMAFFVGQMTTEQVDLLLSGFAAACLFLLYGTVRRNMHPLPGALAFAMALGTKGSMFYFLPGLALAGLIAVWMEGADSRIIRRIAAYGACCLIFVTSPRYIENQLAYGNPFAPKSEINTLHAETTTGFSIRQLSLNTRSYALQLFTQESNPGGIYYLSRYPANWLQAGLPEEVDPYSVSRARQGWFESFREGNVPAEIALFGSTGVAIWLLVVPGFALCLARAKRRNQTAVILLALFLCAVLFHVFFAGMFKWSPFKFRYYLAVAPILALFAAYPLCAIRSEAIRRITTSLVAALALLQGTFFYLNGTWSGLGNFTSGWRTQPGFVVGNKTIVLNEFFTEPSQLAVSLPYYSMLSPFFRTEAGHRTALLSQEKLKQYESAAHFLESNPNHDAVVTPAEFWSDAGKRVAGLAWAGIQGRDGFEVIRQLRDGEPQAPFVRQTAQVWDSEQFGHKFLWQFGGFESNAPIRFSISNSGKLSWGFKSTSSEDFTIPPESEVEVELILSDIGTVEFVLIPMHPRYDPRSKAWPDFLALDFTPPHNDVNGLRPQ